MAFANRSINVQKSTTQDQGCEPAGVTSGITNACTATSTPGTIETPVSFTILEGCIAGFQCPVGGCSIGCTSVICETGGVCTTNNGVQLISCVPRLPYIAGDVVNCIRTEAGTSAASSGGIIGEDAG